MTALSVGGDRLHRGVERRHDLAGSEDRLSGRRTPRNQQIAILIGALASALVLGPILLRLNDSATVYVQLPRERYEL